MSIWNRYTKVKAINSGGMANIYIAVDNFSGKGVAIKEILPQYFKNEEMRQRFKAEANDYLYLKHPRIVKLENFIMEGSTWYIVMEYIEGFNVAEYLKSTPTPMPFQNAAYIIQQVCDALFYMHDKGKVHLDIKPSNIIVNPNNLDVKVIDFGISIDVRNEVLKTPSGTPSYMSPEQINTGVISPQTDIFSLGVTLYEMVTKSLPFTGGSREQLFNEIRTKRTPDVKGFFDHDRKSEARLNEIIQRATRKEPNDRFLTCELMKWELENIY